MNAKEKANDLFTTFRYALSHKDAPLGMHKDNIVIQCALMAVDEILNHHSQEQGLYRIDTYYWQQVKSELQSF
jgi:hypothetical protein